jgi:hypothetical protein
MWQIIITAGVTFVFVALWNLWATSKTRRNQQFMVAGLISEMDEMAKKLGHNDLYSYLAQAKGEKYANTAMANIKSLTQSFSNRGAD